MTDDLSDIELAAEAAVPVLDGAKWFDAEFFLDEEFAEPYAYYLAQLDPAGLLALVTELRGLRENAVRTHPHDVWTMGYRAGLNPAARIGDNPFTPQVAPHSWPSGGFQVTDPINSDVLADIDTVRVAPGHAYRNLGIRPNASFPDFEALE